MSVSSVPRTTVLICNYNYGHFLGAAIDSALGQSHPVDEVIVVDDGSADESSAVVAAYGSRVRWIEQAHAGQAAALQRAIDASTGDVLLLLDADDVFLPHKVATVLEVLHEQPAIEWLVHPLSLADEQLRVLGIQVGKLAPGPIEPHVGSFAERLVTAATSGIVLRRRSAVAALPLIGSNPDAVFHARHDADALLLVRLAAGGARGFALTEPLALYRRHRQQQFPTRGHVVELLQRQIRVARAVAAELGHPWNNGVRPSPCHKHELILMTLRGEPRFSVQRSTEYRSGVRSALLGLRDRPLRALRQLTALTSAYLVPRRWMARFTRSQGWN